MRIIYPRDSWILERAGKELDGLEGKGVYWINYALFDGQGRKPWGAFFTHLEGNLKKKFDEVAGKVDFAVCLNEKIKEYLQKKVKRVEIIKHGHDPRIKKEPVFGWNGRVYKSGRKGEELIEKIGGVLKGDYENAPEFYKKIDYLIVASRTEGGPMCVIDAIASGVPVIARRGAGWCDEFPVIRYETDKELFGIINQLRNPPTWNDWRKQHQSLFSSMN